MSNVATIDPRPSLVAGGRPTAIVPQSMDEAYRLAKAVCMAGMAPKGLDTPEKAMVAILHGLEVGLTPMAALQRIAVVNGRPTIWGDGAIGLVRGSGACEHIHESITGDGEAMVATCSAKRKGEKEPIVGTFSVADAKKAGLWGKQGPWQQFPKRMLQMRARAFALRDGFADVLGGLYLREEIEEDTRRPQPPTPPQREPVAQIASPVPQQSSPTAKALTPPIPPAPPSAKAPQQPPAPDYDGIMDRYRDAIAAAKDEGELDTAYMQVIDPYRDDAPPGFIEQANALDDARRGELGA